MNKIWSAKITLSAPMLFALVIVQIGLTVFSNTSAVRADGANPAGIPPVNAKVNAKYVNGIQAAKAPAANKLLPLNANKQFPASVIPQHSHFGQTWTGTGDGLTVKAYGLSSGGSVVNGIVATTYSSVDGSAGVGGFAASAGKVYGVAGLTTSALGAGVITANTAGGPALEISQGGIKVDGAGIASNTPAFVQQVTSANIDPACTNCTVIDNSLANNNPNAILIVTPDANPSGIPIGKAIYDHHSIEVFYNSWTGHWEITLVDNTSLIVGEAFNVLVITP